MRMDEVLGMFGQNPMEAPMKFEYDQFFKVEEFVEIVAAWSKNDNVFMKIDARKIMGLKFIKPARSTYTNEPFPVDGLYRIVAECKLEGIPLEDRKLEIIQLAI